MNRKQIETRFPIGTKVTNMNVEAYVVGFAEHLDGSIDLLIAEKKNGKIRKSRWLADPRKCTPA